MSHYDLVISRCKRLESLLETNFAAHGRGLHEKTDSVADKLPQPLIKKLHYIATIRNKLIHEDTGNRIEDPGAYKKACSEAEKELKRLSSPSRRGCSARVILIALIIASAFAVVYIIHRM